jgi:hypothetical protein
MRKRELKAKVLKYFKKHKTGSVLSFMDEKVELLQVSEVLKELLKEGRLKEVE